MRKVVILISITTILVVASCGGGGKYADAKKAVNTQSAMMEEFVVAVDKARNSKEIVAALEQFQKSAEDAKEEMLGIAEKYPELKNRENLPKELEKEMKRMEGMMPRFIDAMMKIGQQYREDPEVKKALEKMQALSQAIS